MILRQTGIEQAKISLLAVRLALPPPIAQPLFRELPPAHPLVQPLSQLVPSILTVLAGASLDLSVPQDLAAVNMVTAEQHPTTAELDAKQPQEPAQVLVLLHPWEDRLLQPPRRLLPLLLRPPLLPPARPPLHRPRLLLPARPPPHRPRLLLQARLPPRPLPSPPPLRVLWTLAEHVVALKATFVPQDNAVVNMAIVENQPLTAAPAANLPSEPAQQAALLVARLAALLVALLVARRRPQAQTAPAVAAKATPVAPLLAVVNMATAAHPLPTAALDASLPLENVLRKVFRMHFVKLRCVAAFC